MFVSFCLYLSWSFRPVPFRSVAVARSRPPGPSGSGLRPPARGRPVRPGGGGTHVDPDMRELTTQKDSNLLPGNGT